ncbi:hypothetical protein [Paraburkholderia sp. J76]|uniref:hypothetical protein n=1 Tax=Paraburkholderia sp. J76 TaxID=2805439 RepID=UPI002ABD4AD2|nr:hypothetical protein [Paraburkholderia sp. J76]
MRYNKEFFDLQIRFAQTVAALIDMPIEKALLDYTNIYVRFGLGRAFDQHHPIWRCYADGLSQSVDLCDWTYGFYLARAEVTQTRSTVATSGCFSYAIHNAECVRIHFENVEPATVSPLSIDRLPVRREELRSLFDHVRRNQREATRVAGTSWLYNLRSYRRCFPDEYSASVKVAESRFRNMSLWGQFLDRHGAVRVGVAENFTRRLSHIANLKDLVCSFPLQALAVEAPIEQFYRFYRV